MSDVVGRQASKETSARLKEGVESNLLYAEMRFEETKKKISGLTTVVEESSSTMVNQFSLLNQKMEEKLLMKEFFLKNFIKNIT